MITSRDSLDRNISAKSHKKKCKSKTDQMRPWHFTVPEVTHNPTNEKLIKVGFVCRAHIVPDQISFEVLNYYPHSCIQKGYFLPYIITLDIDVFDKSTKAFLQCCFFFTKRLFGHYALGVYYKLCYHAIRR